MEQRSNEWLNARLGLITSTRAHQLLSSAATRKTLMRHLIKDFAIAKPKEFEGTPSMKRGIKLEEEAISYYELKTGNKVSGSGLIVSDIHPLLATSPDGLIGDDGGIEVKCYEAEAHIDAVVGHEKKDVINQCKWHLFVTARDWWDLFYYSDEFEGRLKCIKQTVVLPEEEAGKIKSTALNFIAELEVKLEELGLAL